MRARALLLLAIILPAALVQALQRTPHADYDAAPTVQPPLALALSALLRGWLPETGLVANYTQLRKLLRSVSLPPMLVARLDALLSYAENFTELTGQLRRELAYCEEQLRLGFIDEARSALQRSALLLWNASVVLHEAELLAEDLFRMFPQAAPSIRARLAGMRCTLEELQAEHRRLSSLLRTLETGLASRIPTRISLSINATEVSIFGVVRVWGRLTNETGDPLPASMPVRILVLPPTSQTPIVNLLVLTNAASCYEALLKLVLPPGDYVLRVLFIPPSDRYLPCANQTRIRVTPITTWLRIDSFNESLLPGGLLRVSGEILTELPAPRSGWLTIKLASLSRSVRVEDRFEIKIRLPRLMPPGKYEAELSFTPGLPYLAPCTATLNLTVLEPPIACDADIKLRRIVACGCLLPISITPRCPVNTTFTVLVSFLGTLYNVTGIPANTAFRLSLLVPFDAETGRYPVRILLIPSSPEVAPYEYDAAVIIVGYQLPAIFSILLLLSALILPRIPRPPLAAPRPSSLPRPAPPPSLPHPIAPSPRPREPSLEDMRRRLNELELALCQHLRIPLKPGYTHREVCSLLGRRSALLARYLRVMVHIFEQAYYGMKRLDALAKTLFKDTYDYLKRLLRRMRRENP